MTVAVTGATGFVGQAVLDKAAQLAQPLRALTRRDQKPRHNVEWIAGDLFKRDALKRLVTGTEAVIHIAGVVNAPDAEGFEAGNVTGTLEIIEAAVAAGVPRFIFVSSLAARQPNLSAYGASKAKAEKIVAASGLDWTIVRPPAVYGPHDREMLDLFKAAKWGVVPMPPNGRASMIHVTDLARLLLALLPGGEDVTRQVFEPDDGRADGWTHREMGRAIGRAMGKRPWVPHLSKPTLLKLSRIEKRLRGDKAKLTEDRVNYMTHPDWVCHPDRYPPSNRWTPHVVTREGLKDTADWYRAQGWL